jgi:hypothetical protein
VSSAASMHLDDHDLKQLDCPMVGWSNTFPWRRTSFASGSRPRRRRPPTVSDAEKRTPCLSNRVLDDLERVVRDAVPRRSRVNFVRYGGDFIITGKSKRLFEGQVKPAVEAFLAERGLIFSEEKTSNWRGCGLLRPTSARQGEALAFRPHLSGVQGINWLHEAQPQGRPTGGGPYHYP